MSPTPTPIKPSFASLISRGTPSASGEATGRLVWQTTVCLVVAALFFVAIISSLFIVSRKRSQAGRSQHAIAATAMSEADRDVLSHKHLRPYSSSGSAPQTARPWFSFWLRRSASAATPRTSRSCPENGRVGPSHSLAPHLRPRELPQNVRPCVHRDTTLRIPANPLSAAYTPHSYASTLHCSRSSLTLV
ncbi:hypothetical protein BV25DRAFT_962862 [Artomyces pyxidatus]|uniref:Uncharacterized protein n=1 Tax=Artomyces pyxidatus TaxID=48021 RepID=A0ACB8SXL7_9AGAM|nr:hypothetical protein BV25DRAFT_962862 [Artomyces pyxidatus]